MNTLTLDKLEEILMDLPDERINPMTKVTNTLNGACLYTDPDDPTLHCIAGEIISRMGWPLPGIEFNKTGISSLQTGTGTAYNFTPYPTAEYVDSILDVIQRVADSASFAKKSNAWGEAKKTGLRNISEIRELMESNGEAIS